jgi:hypothetical protein
MCVVTVYSTKFKKTGKVCLLEYTDIAKAIFMH